MRQHKSHAWGLVGVVSDYFEVLMGNFIYSLRMKELEEISGFVTAINAFLKILNNLKIKCNKMSPKEKIHGSNYITSSTCRRNKDSDGKRKKTRRRKHEEEKKEMEDRGWTLKDLDLEATEPGYRLH